MLTHKAQCIHFLGITQIYLLTKQIHVKTGLYLVHKPLLAAGIWEDNAQG